MKQKFPQYLNAGWSAVGIKSQRLQWDWNPVLCSFDQRTLGILRDMFVESRMLTSLNMMVLVSLVQVIA